jgi:hypothetical protein
MVVAFSACVPPNGQVTSTPTTKPATPTTTQPITTQPTTTEAPTPQGPAPGYEVLVKLETAGGFVGTGQGSLVITTDGEMVHKAPDGTEEYAVLPAAKLNEVFMLLADAPWGTTPQVPPNPSPCADVYIYTVSFQDFTVTADDCTISTLPESMQPVFSRLIELLLGFVPTPA